MIPSRYAPFALAALRIMTALLFLEHATMKFLEFPAPVPGVPHPLPAIILVAGAIEVIAGILVLIGFKTRIAAFVASGEMAVAYFMAHMSQGFWPVLNQGEAAILFCFIFLYLAFQGPGALSIDGSGEAETAGSR